MAQNRPAKTPDSDRQGAPPFDQGELVFLTEREQAILRMRYGLSPDGERHTLKAVGRAFGVTPERVRRIQNDALAKIRRRRADDAGL